MAVWVKATLVSVSTQKVLEGKRKRFDKMCKTSTGEFPSSFFLVQTSHSFRHPNFFFQLAWHVYRSFLSSIFCLPFICTDFICHIFFSIVCKYFLSNLIQSFAWCSTLTHLFNELHRQNWFLECINNVLSVFLTEEAILSYEAVVQQERK